MIYYNVMFPQDEAYEVMNKLGQLGLLHLEDCHKGDIASHRPFAVQVAEIHHIIGKLDEIQQIMVEHGFIPPTIEIDDDTVKVVIGRIDEEMKGKPSAEYFETLKTEIHARYDVAKDMTDDYKTIEKKIIDSRDYISALETFNATVPMAVGQSRTRYEDLHLRVQLDYMLGVISNQDLAKFQRALFRLTRGNAYANYANVQTKANIKNESELPNKTVFFVAFPSSKVDVLNKRLRRLCEAMNARLFDVPENIFDLNAELDRAHVDNEEAIVVLKTTEVNIFESLRYFFGSSYDAPVPYITQIRVALLKRLAIYENLNKLEVRGNNIMEGYFWISHDSEVHYHEFVIENSRLPEFMGYRHHRLNYLKVGKTPPTLIETNIVTAPFQEIVNTYGVPTYKEANPGLFTVVTFPFLFGVMFGDMGHGLLLTAFALSLFLTHKAFMTQVRPFRYLLLSMGIMATFCGLIYNEFLSVPVPLFDTCYEKSKGQYVRKHDSCVYPVGFDYTWDNAGNSVSFVNSFKMKISIIIGVAHMLLGIALKGANGLYFHDFLSFFFEFLPQFVFMLATFGYMCFCIIVKWLTKYDDPSSAPSIIAIFINLVGKIDQPLYGSSHTQQTVQQILVVLALICVPLMWLVKPVITTIKQKAHHDRMAGLEAHGYGQRRLSVYDNDDESETLISNKDAKHANTVDDETHDTSELFVHQSIETIEFVLGSVSNTASYLRLWALSLAHSQLARVFLDMLVKPFYEGEGNPYLNAVGLILAFFVFLLVTTAVLMLMDVMECFLHALRLHWVEFQNKFYKGTGYKFESYDHMKAVVKLLHND